MKHNELVEGNIYTMNDDLSKTRFRIKDDILEHNIVGVGWRRSDFSYNFVVRAEFEKYKEPQKPVDFITAASSGERIKYEDWGKYCELADVLRILNQKLESTLREMITEKKWYIEDER